MGPGYWYFDQSCPGDSKVQPGLGTTDPHGCLWSAPFKMRMNHLHKYCNPTAASMGPKPRDVSGSRQVSEQEEQAGWGLAQRRCAGGQTSSDPFFPHFEEELAIRILTGNTLSTSSLSKFRHCAGQSVDQRQTQGHKFAWPITLFSLSD